MTIVIGIIDRDFRDLSTCKVKRIGDTDSRGRNLFFELHPVVLKYDSKIEIRYDMNNPCGIPGEDYSLPIKGVRNGEGYDIYVKGSKVDSARDANEAKLKINSRIDPQGKLVEKAE